MVYLIRRCCLVGMFPILLQNEIIVLDFTLEFALNLRNRNVLNLSSWLTSIVF